MKRSSVQFALGLAAFLAVALAVRIEGQEAIELKIDARSLQPGELVVLTMTTVESADTLTVQAFNRDVPVFRLDSRTWRALVGIDLDTPLGPHAIAIVTRRDQLEWRKTSTVTVLPRSFPTRHLRVNPKFVNPSPEASVRIALEAEELERTWMQSSPTRLWNEPFVRPVPDRSTSVFGTRSIFNGQRRNPHSGDDFPSPAGTPIQAPNAGRVALARDRYFTGNTVIIDHGLGMFSLLAHLSVMNVQEGDRVTAGQEVGRVGATGRVTGPHLHWAVRVDTARVDPISVLTLLGDGSAVAEAGRSPR